MSTATTSSWGRARSASLTPMWLCTRMPRRCNAYPSTWLAVCMIIHRMAAGEDCDLGAHSREVGFVARALDHVRDQVCSDDRFLHLEAASRHGRGSESDAGGNERLLRVVRDPVLVAGDVRSSQGRLGLLPRQRLWTKIYEHEVALGTTGNDPEPALGQSIGHGRRVLQDLRLVVAELRR